MTGAKRMRPRSGGGAGSIVLIVFGAIFLLSGIGTTAEGAMISSLPGTLGSAGGTYEALGVAILVVGLILLVAGIVLYRRR